MVLRPNAIKRAVVGHPVQNHTHAQVMGRGRQCTQIIVGAVIWIHRVVILDAVRASQRTASGLDDVIVLVFSAFAVHLSNRVNRHQPQNVHPEVFQSGQVWDERLDRALWRVLTQVDFVDRGIFGPLGMHELIGQGRRTFHLCCARRRWGSTRSEGSGNEHQCESARPRL